MPFHIGIEWGASIFRGGFTHEHGKSGLLILTQGWIRIGRHANFLLENDTLFTLLPRNDRLLNILLLLQRSTILNRGRRGSVPSFVHDDLYLEEPPGAPGHHFDLHLLRHVWHVRHPFPSLLLPPC